MTITPASSVFTFNIPGLAANTVYELIPDFINLGGYYFFGIPYCVNYLGGQTVQSFSAEGVLLNSSDNLIYEGPGTVFNTSNNGQNPQGVPGGITAAHGFEGFGGTYSNEFLGAWSNSSSDGTTYSLDYIIYINTSGLVTASSAQTLFDDLTPVTVPSSVPWDDWTHIREASTSDGNVLVGIDSVDASDTQQLNFAIVRGDNTVTKTLTYSDPTWTSGQSYAWNVGVTATNSTYVLYNAETVGQTASLHRSLISESGVVTSSWTDQTGFSEIDRISWNSASTGYIAMDLSGVMNGAAAHQVSIINSTTGAITETLTESYAGTLYSEARIISLGSANGDSFLEYWVDSSGLTLQQVSNTGGQLSVTATYVISGANGSASATSLGSGKVQVTWQVRSGDPTQVTAEGVSAIDYTEIFTICFMAGTRIRTPEGEAAIETLKPGDLVLTREGVVKPVNWLGKQTVSPRFADPLRVLPIRIRAGALGENTPSRDLLVSPDHALLVEDTLIHAGALVNGTSITREAHVPEVFVYYHVELDDHSLILAENTPSETFVDNAERLNFDNWAEFEALYPKGKAVEELPHPRAKAHRQVPARIRAALDRRARAIGAVASAAA